MREARSHGRQAMADISTAVQVKSIAQTLEIAGAVGKTKGGEKRLGAPQSGFPFALFAALNYVGIGQGAGETKLSAGGVPSGSDVAVSDTSIAVQGDSEDNITMQLQNADVAGQGLMARSGAIKGDSAMAAEKDVAEKSGSEGETVKTAVNVMKEGKVGPVSSGQTSDEAVGFKAVAAAGNMGDQQTIIETKQVQGAAAELLSQADGVGAPDHEIASNANPEKAGVANIGQEIKVAGNAQAAQENNIAGEFPARKTSLIQKNQAGATPQTSQSQDADPGRNSAPTAHVESGEMQPATQNKVVLAAQPPSQCEAQTVAYATEQAGAELGGVGRSSHDCSDASLAADDIRQGVARAAEPIQAFKMPEQMRDVAAQFTETAPQGEFNQRMDVQANPSAVLSAAVKLTSSAGVQSGNSLEPIAAQAVVDQAVDGSVALYKSGATRVRLNLNPPQLGSLDVDLLVSRDRVKVVLTAETGEARNILQLNSDQLKSSLQVHGLNVDKFDVLLKEHDSQNFSQSSGQNLGQNIEQNLTQNSGQFFGSGRDNTGADASSWAGQTRNGENISAGQTSGSGRPVLVE